MAAEISQKEHIAYGPFWLRLYFGRTLAKSGGVRKQAYILEAEFEPVLSVSANKKCTSENESHFLLRKCAISAIPLAFSAANVFCDRTIFLQGALSLRLPITVRVAPLRS